MDIPSYDTEIAVAKKLESRELPIDADAFAQYFFNQEGVQSRKKDRRELARQTIAEYLFLITNRNPEEISKEMAKILEMRNEAILEIAFHSAYGEWLSELLQQMKEPSKKNYEWGNNFINQVRGDLEFFDSI